jgi:hypothetical protein
MDDLDNVVPFCTRDEYEEKCRIRRLNQRLAAVPRETEYEDYVDRVYRLERERRDKLMVERKAKNDRLAREYRLR